MDTRSVLRPLKGPGISVEAGRALGSEPGARTGLPQPLPGAMMPRRLTPLNPLTSIPEERGKGPLGGKPIPKKLIPGTEGREKEGVDGASGEGSSSASPPFETTRPLPLIASSSIGGPSNAPLPPIGGSNLPPLSSSIKKLPTPLPRLTTRPDLPGMPSRQAPTSDPFSSDSPLPGQGPASPGPGLISRMPPTRASISRVPPTPLSSSPRKEPGATANLSPKPNAGKDDQTS